MGLKPAGLRGSLRNISQVDDIPDSGAARLTFDDADTSGSTAFDVWNDNDGTINGATTGQTGIAGYDSGQAYSFTTDDYVSVASDPRLQLQQGFYIGGWVEFSSASGLQTLISSRGATNDGYQLRYSFSNSRWNWLVSDGGSLHQYQYSVSEPTGTPVHIVAGVDNDGTVRLYRNGSEVTGTNGSGDGVISSPTTRSTERAIGRNGDDNAEYMEGIIDDPRWYDDELTPTQVSNWYNTGSITG